MTYYLSDPATGDTDVSFTDRELAETFNVDADEIDDASVEEALNSLGVALVLTDELMGDDPAKFDAMQNMTRALGVLASTHDVEVSVDYDPTTGQITIDKTPR